MAFIVELGKTNHSKRGKCIQKAAVCKKANTRFVRTGYYYR